MRGELNSIIRAEIEANGPVPFNRFVDQALYARGLGFYAAVGQAGTRRGDFVTSVETGPLFAAIVGEWLDERWRTLGCPDPFVVAEAAAGIGTLWRGVRNAAPACFSALEWIFVERSERLQATHAELPSGRWASATQLPAERVHCIVANELLDNLAFDIVEMTPSGWCQLGVETVASSGSESGSESQAGFTLVHMDSAGSATSPPLPSDVPVGTRLPWPTGAIDWLTNAQARSEHVLAFDYVADNVTLIEREMTGWLRTYHGHDRGSDPFADVGHRDITHDVPIDLLPSTTRTTLQADWLREYGLEDRVEQARQTWRERAQIGDLAAMFARSAIGESEALTDPTGLGSFHVLEW